MDNDYEIDWLISDALEDRWRNEPTEPSFEWDVENFAAARSEAVNA